MTDSRAEPRVAVIGLEEGWSSRALAEAFEERTGFGRVVDLAQVVVDLQKGTAKAGDLDLCTLDGLVVKKVGAAYGPEMLDRLELLRYVASRGVHVFSPPEKIFAMVNRVSCTTALAAAGLPMPPTVLTEDVAEAIRAVDRFGEAVLKPIYSTKARGFRLLGPESDLETEFEKHRAQTGHPLFYLQQKIDLSGRDLGIVFLESEYLGTYARVAGEGAWETTIHSGGRYEAFDPQEEVVALARRAADLFGLTLCGVDVALTPEGPMLFEVSAFGGFRGLRDGLGIDGAARLADHVVARLRS